MKVRKKREMSTEDEDRKVELPVTPRQRRPKKKKKEDYDDSDPVDIMNDIVEESSSRAPDALTPQSAAEKLKSQAKSSSSRSQKRKRQKRDSGTSSDEERWLEKIKDPKMMTARQRAMYERGNEKEVNSIAPPEVLMALPTGYKEKVLSAEALEKAQLMSQKRKQMADEKREKDKKKTMERLLKKQDSKMGKNSKNQRSRTILPTIIYRNTLEGITMTYPPNFSYPLAPQGSREAPKATPCVICGHPKKYNCSKTNVPLCSFRCYKQNVASIQQIFC
ncbi:INO80 complex subunit B [Phlebotomus argentipes]|uniref:INO80 complex subunit B n=1 Tax=Phlebotomus argentipes TaxID=94469 RepID=UPI002892F460|nr:INO80 complex subunit B [Phlebotomus argentipes]